MKLSIDLKTALLDGTSQESHFEAFSKKLPDTRSTIPTTINTKRVKNSHDCQEGNEISRKSKATKN